MSKAKKLKKVKQPMNPRAKSVLINSFKGIISNQACIDNGKEAPWWLAIIFFLFAIIIPLIPSHVQLSKAYGASFFNNGAYETDRGLANLSYTLNSKNSKLEVLNGMMHYYKEGSSTSFSGTDEMVNVTGEFDRYYVEEGVEKVEHYTEYTFFVLFSTESDEMIQNIVKQHQYVMRSTTPYDLNDPVHVEKGYYVPSYLILKPDTIMMSIQKMHTHDRISSTPAYLDWKHTANTDNLVAAFLSGLDTSVTLSVFLSNANNVNTVYERWKGIFNDAYITQKEAVKWNTTLIYLGVYAGLMVFLGLMLFLLTRGKNNPFRSLNFWVTQKIGYFLSFTPAVLALIIGFIIPANVISQMAFIMLVSLRVMWASMRQLRPVQ